MIANISYFFSFFLFSLSLYAIFASKNRLKKLCALNLFQTSVIWFYLSIGKVKLAIAPILNYSYNQIYAYNNPLPQVLMLTAIVVGITIFALGLNFIKIIERE